MCALNLFLKGKGNFKLRFLIFLQRVKPKHKYAVSNAFPRLAKLKQKKMNTPKNCGIFDQP